MLLSNGIFYYKEFENDHTFRGQCCDVQLPFRLIFSIIVVSVRFSVAALLSIMMFIQVQMMMLAGIPVTITGIWALVRSSTLYLSSTLPHSVIIQGPVHNMFFPITTQASISVIIISCRSVLVIIVGVLVIAVNIGCVLFVKCERPSGSKRTALTIRL